MDIEFDLHSTVARLIVLKQLSKKDLCVDIIFRDVEEMQTLMYIREFYFAAALNDLEKMGKIKKYKAEFEGALWPYYSITAAGKRYLKFLNQRIRKLNELLDSY